MCDCNIKYTAEQKRELGKAYFFDCNKENRNYGLKLIIEAHNENDLEATYIVAKLIIDGVLKTSANDQVEYALTLMCSLANSGYIQARTYLNSFCNERYNNGIAERQFRDGTDQLFPFNIVGTLRPRKWLAFLERHHTIF